MQSETMIDHALTACGRAAGSRAAPHCNASIDVIPCYANHGEKHFQRPAQLAQNYHATNIVDVGSLRGPLSSSSDPDVK